MHAADRVEHEAVSDGAHQITAGIARLQDAEHDAALPQTQCGRCGYAGCRPYAEAIARGEAPINRCPPGGMEGVGALARITGQPTLPLDPACGTETPPRVACIDEDVGFVGP